MKRYDVFLLDADDTLFDFAACCQNALRRAMQGLGFSYGEGYHLRYLEINDALWRRLERREITHQQLFSLRFNEFLNSIGESTEKALQLNLTYISALSEECVPLAGAEDFLKELKTLGRVYIITNGTASVQRGRFQKFPLEKYVESIFISEELGVYKPSQAYFDQVVSQIPHFQKERALVIGDSLTSDIALANGAKVDCVWYNPRKISLKSGFFPTYTAENYEEILKIIQN